jgi:hypothetical protein
MSNFNFNNETVSDFATIANSIHGSYYPAGEVVIRNTSYYSKEYGNKISREKTLSSTSLSRAMSGDVLYRSPVYSQNFYNSTLIPSLNNVLGTVSAAANTTNDTYKIDNPEDGIGKTELKGGSATARHYVDSVAGKKAASDFVLNAAESISADYSIKLSYPDEPPGGVPGQPSGNIDNGAGNSAGTNPGTYTGDSSNPSAGSRVITVESTLSPEEKGWLLDRSMTLKNLNTTYSSSVLTYGYNFDINNKFNDLDTTGSNYPGITGSNKVSKELIDQPSQKAYICPAMIELMLYLNSKIEIRGGFGWERGENQNTQGPNLSSLTEGGTITDHALGRAFDIDVIGPLNSSNSPNRVILGKEGGNRNRYLIALTTLMEAFSDAPIHLIPDHFAISIDLAQEFGIQTKGFEPDTCKMKTMYPAIKYANFSADEVHRTHIHMSFSGVRSGIYTGPGGQMGGAGTRTTVNRAPDKNEDSASRQRSNITAVTPPAGSIVDSGEPDVPVDTVTPTPSDTTSDPAGLDFATYHRETRSNSPFYPPNTNRTSPTSTTISSGVTGEFVTPTDLSDAKFSKGYSTEPNGKLSREEVFALLRLTVMSDEAAAIFCSIATREGGLQPRACNVSDVTGDWSGGMFQCNLLPGANGGHTFFIPLPSQTQMAGWQIGYKDWDKDDVDLSNFNAKALPKAKALSKGDRWSLFDSRMWIPINQAYITYTVATGGTIFSGTKLGLTAETGYVFKPWGDYGGGPTYGFLSNIKFSIARDLYVSLGKTEQQLKDWVLKMFQTSGKNSKAAPYAARWLEGEEFRV